VRGEVEHRSPNVGRTALLFYLRSLSSPCLLLKCLDPRYFLVTSPSILKITDDLTIPPVPPGFFRVLNPILQVGYFVGDMLL
jgi:hypothetical protein